MAHVSSLKSVWEITDNSYMQATKFAGRAPESWRPSPEVKNQRNRLQRAENGSECDNASEDGSTYEAFQNFDAIPEEFRPSKQGKGLLKVRTTPNKGNSKETLGAEDPHQDKRYPIRPNESLRKRDTRNSDSSTVQNESRNYKKELVKTEESERDIDLISDETEKQKKLGGIFFYNCSSQNESTIKEARESQQNRSGRKNSRTESSEKLKLKNLQDESSQSKFFNSNSNQSKATNEFEMHSSFARNKDETNFPRSDKNSFPKFQDPTASSQNKVPFVEKGIQKITAETTVTKRIQWKDDLCTFKKPENKPKFFYEYTKTTKQSISRVPSHSEDDEEVTKMLCQNFKKERTNFRRRGPFNPNGESRQRHQNQKDEGFNTNRVRKKEGGHFVPERPQKPVYKFEERHDCFQCCKGKDPIIVRHEIKVFHEYGQGKNNRTFHNSFQKSRPPKKDRNVQMINTDNRRHCGMMMGGTGENIVTKTAKNNVRPSSKLTDSSSETESARNDKMINTDDRRHCGLMMGKAVESTMAKTIKSNARPSSKLTDSSSETKSTRETVSLTSNSDSNENAAILINYGREISDMIAGSHVAISTFLDNYEQWKDFRRVTMLLFEEFEKNLSQSCNKNKKIIEVAEMVGTGCKMVQYVPHFGVSVAAKIIACLSDIVAKIFSSSKSAKSIDMDDFQLRLCLQKDMEATSDIYLHGLQCDMQFQETCKIIEEFHSDIKNGLFEKFVETFETGFLKEISLLSPKHPEVFYKRLERFYKLLNHRQQSEEGAAFCRAFEDWPDALETISILPRRFKTANWDSSPVLKTWEEIYNLCQNDQSVVGDVLKKIQDCICVLVREQSVMEKYVMDLQRRS